MSCGQILAEQNLKKQQIASLPITKAAFLNSEEKRIWIREQFAVDQQEFRHDQSVTLVINRNNVLEETISQFETVGDLNLKGKVKIFFVDEEAQDAGGVIKEWIDLLIDSLFSQELGHFELNCETEEPFYTLSPDASPEIMLFAGKIIGKALYEGIPISARLNPLLMKEIAGEDLTIEDMKFYDPQVYNSLKYMAGASEAELESLGQTFTVMDNGEEVELRSEGFEMTVTKQNRGMYFTLFLKYYSSIRCLEQTNSFYQGFYQIINPEYLQVLSSFELESLLFGSKKIDIKDWKANTFYKGKYADEKEKHRVVKWFWDYVEKQNEEQL